MKLWKKGILPWKKRSAYGRKNRPILGPMEESMEEKLTLAGFQPLDFMEEQLPKSCSKLVVTAPAMR
jgi:hypothetical protein